MKNITELTDDFDIFSNSIFGGGLFEEIKEEYAEFEDDGYDEAQEEQYEYERDLDS